jgi:uncharacterized protein (TIGR02266 family)
MRTPITLKIKFKSASLDQFIERYSVDVSRGGIFIRTKEPLAVGTQLKFEFQLQDASSLIAGEGTVVWIREHDPSRTGVAPGMGVKFDKLQSASQQVLDKILSEKSKRGDAQMESRFDAGVRASASVSGTVSAAPPPPVAVVKGHNDFGGGDSKAFTPLPAPVPGLDAPGDEFGQESTRVMQDSIVQKLADQTRDVARASRNHNHIDHQSNEDAANAFAESEPTRKASVEQMEQLQKAVALPTGEMPALRQVQTLAPELKVEAKVETRPEPKVEAKPEPKVEHKPDEAKPEAKPEPKVEAKVEHKPEPKAVDKKTGRNRQRESVDKEPPKDAERSVATAATRAQEPKKSSMMPYLLVLIVAGAGGGYWWFGRGDQPVEPPKTATTEPTPAANAAPNVAVVPTPTPTPTPGENAVNPANPAVAIAPTPGTPNVAVVPTPEKPNVAVAPTPEKPVPAVPEKPVGISVAVTSDPAGALVVVNGKPLPDPTPTTLGDLDAKKVYDVQMTMKGFKPWKVKLKPKAGDKLEAALVPNEKLVEVSSTPAGADVMLDGKRVGKTPFTIHKIDVTKTHALELKRVGFVSQSRTITASDVFEPKGDKDVLAVALKLEAEPKPVAEVKPVAPKTPKPVKPIATGEKPASEKPVGEAPSEKPAPVAEKPVAEKPVVEKPAVEKPEKPAPVEKPVAEKPVVEKPAAEKPAAEKPAAEKPASEGDKPAIKVPSWMKKKPADAPPAEGSAPPAEAKP